MSRSSFIVGLLIAIALHGLLLRGAISRRPQPDEKRAEASVTVLPREPEPIPPPPKPTDPEPIAEPIAPPPAKVFPEADTEPEQELEAPKPELVEVAKPVAAPEQPSERPAEPQHDRSDDTQASEDLLTAVRIEWRSADEVLGVAAALGIRILAVDRTGTVLGEIVMGNRGAGRFQLSEYEAQGSYSNRVREIRDPRFFGDDVFQSLRDRVHAYWLLLTPELDRAIAEIVRRELDSRGVPRSDVRYVRGRFNWNDGEGAPRFEVEAVVRREGTK